MAGQAIPSFAPQQAAAHFQKLECFCFKQQTLAAHETRRFPVVFFIDPALPKDVRTITLSYTFFEVAGAVKDHAAVPAPVPRGTNG
jgi:cytochrome c oxidase assembly protein subunit 11